MGRKINPRSKGHAYERKLVQELKEKGFSECVTSRSESKRMDDLKVDLCYTDPFYIQAKAVEKLGPPHNVLSQMPEKKGFINLLFHKINRKGEVVSMKKEDFYTILDIVKDKL